MLTIRRMTMSEWPEVAALIYSSTNAWYQKNRDCTAFSGPPEDCLRFCETYETLDPGCTLVVYDDDQKRIAGNCFFHPRQTHISLGILNVHPDYFGQGVARQLVSYIVTMARQEGRPLRLVSSAMNLDSFSIYSRFGFVPFDFFQDMLISVPETGVSVAVSDEYSMRNAELTDIPAMTALEMYVQGIGREKDFRFFIENQQKIWSTTILERETDKKVVGFLTSIEHPGTTMLGPGCMIDQAAALALITYELNKKPGRDRIVLVPSRAKEITKVMYKLGGKNIETHIAQCCGEFMKPHGIVIPCFLPETN